MRRIGCIVLMTSWLFIGCYDLSFGSDSHTVTDFQILAIHVEPPELRPGTPMWADVLYADPKGNGKPIQSAWSVRVLDRETDESRIGAVAVSSSEPWGTRLYLPAPSFRTVDKGSDPLLLLEIYLCKGTLVDPARIGFVSDGELLQTLCKDGPLVSGVKFVSGPESGSPKNNPQIDRLTVEGVAMTALEDGGGTYLLCADAENCGRSFGIAAYLDPDTIDMRSLKGFVLEERLPDGGNESDGGVNNLEVPEYHRIDWYVTGGRLSLPSSSIQSATPTQEAAQGPYQTAWQPPEITAKSVEYTLFAIVRDMWGGNGWKTYRFRVGNAK